MGLWGRRPIAVAVMDEMRAMLDELMGQDRDGDRVVYVVCISGWTSHPREDCTDRQTLTG